MGYLKHKTMAELFHAEKQATEIALTEAGRPNATVTVDRINEETMGESDHVFAILSRHMPASFTISMPSINPASNTARN